MTQAAVCIMGPTASGKTDLALALAERYPFEIISVDSAMVYRGMDIGTAKPDKATLAQYPHRLIDILDPVQAYSAADFCRDAQQAIGEIQQRGAWPLLVGGTFLYFNALLDGLSELPSADAGLRQQLLDRAQQYGWSHMHQELSQVDALSAQRIHPNDPQRIQRALEVYYASGKPLSVWHAESKRQQLVQPALKLILANDDRKTLGQKISKRFQQMLKLGFVEEVEQLFAREDLHQDLPSMRCVGYRQIWQYLDQQFSYEEMQEKAVIATRQFAKRQYTWLRRERQLNWLDPSSNQVLDLAEKNLINAGFQL